MKTFEITCKYQDLVYGVEVEAKETETWTEIKEKVLGAVHRIELAIETKRDITGVYNENS